MSDTNAATAKRLLVSAMMLGLMIGGPAKGQDEKDPHRPACTRARCRKIKSFLKAHYCSKSPAGNGPDDGCEISRPKEHAAEIKVAADFHCEWMDGGRKCQQRGQPSSEVRNTLIGELRKLGLAPKATGQISFTVWESAAAGWSLAAATYDHLAGADMTLCSVILIIDQNSHVHVLRKVRFQKTNVDAPMVTTWFPIDLADVKGDGHIEIILEGDAYENHWLEVDALRDGSFQTIFSGLGYFL
jgi:hypothetical protein